MTIFRFMGEITQRSCLSHLFEIVVKTGKSGNRQNNLSIGQAELLKRPHFRKWDIILCFMEGIAEAIWDRTSDWCKFFMSLRLKQKVFTMFKPSFEDLCTETLPMILYFNSVLNNEYSTVKVKNCYQISKCWTSDKPGTCCKKGNHGRLVQGSHENLQKAHDLYTAHEHMGYEKNRNHAVSESVRYMYIFILNEVAC